MTAQKLFLLCRKDRNLITDLFDHVHEIYRMELPYFDKGNEKTESQEKKMAETHDVLRKAVDVYVMQNDSYKKHNFGTLYYKIDAFFTELTKIAVEKSFFPKASRQRTVDELTESMRLK